MLNGNQKYWLNHHIKKFVELDKFNLDIDSSLSYAENKQIITKQLKLLLSPEEQVEKGVYTAEDARNDRELLQMGANRQSSAIHHIGKGKQKHQKNSQAASQEKDNLKISKRGSRERCHKRSVKDICDFAIKHCRNPKRMGEVLQALLKHYYNGTGATSKVLQKELEWNSDRTVRYYLKKLRDWGFINAYNIFVSQEVAKKAGVVSGLIAKGKFRYIQFEGYYVTLLLKESVNKHKYEAFRNKIYECSNKKDSGITISVLSPNKLGVYFPRFIDLPGAGFATFLKLFHTLIKQLREELDLPIGVTPECFIKKRSCNFKLVGKIGATEFSFYNHPLAVEHYRRLDKYKGKHASINFSPPGPSLEIKAESHDQLMYLVKLILIREDEKPFKTVQEVEKYCEEQLDLFPFTKC